MNRGLFPGRELALDLGSSNLVLSAGRSVLLREPTQGPEGEDSLSAEEPARQPRTRRGEPAPIVSALSSPDAVPVRHGRIVNPEALDPLLERLLQRAREGNRLSWLIRGATGVLVPPVLSEEERLRLEDLAHRHGLHPTRPIELASALALGCGVSRDSPQGQMVVDIGGGKAFIAVFSMGGLVAWHWADAGSEALEQALAEYVERRYLVRLTLREAERVKIHLGAVYPQERPQRMKAVGIQIRSGLAQEVTLDDGEVRDVLVDACERLVLAIHQGFKHVPPEMASDIARDGVILAGGGALLRGLPEYLAERIGLRVRCAPDPINAAIRGAREQMRTGGRAEEAHPSRGRDE